MENQTNTYRQDLKLQAVTPSAKDEHPIVALFPLDVEEKEYTWPANWSWSDDMIVF